MGQNCCQVEHISVCSSCSTCVLVARCWPLARLSQPLAYCMCKTAHMVVMVGQVLRLPSSLQPHTAFANHSCLVLCVITTISSKLCCHWHVVTLNSSCNLLTVSRCCVSCQGWLPNIGQQKSSDTDLQIALVTPLAISTKALVHASAAVIWMQMAVCVSLPHWQRVTTPAQHQQASRCMPHMLRQMH